MLVSSSLLLWAMVQVLIPGSLTSPHVTNIENSACIDISPNCAINAFQCDTNTYVQENCRKTCNLCSGSTRVPSTTTEVADPSTTSTTSTTDPPTTTLPECGGGYSSHSGTIRHPSSGINYTNDESCVWTITTGEPFNITFVSFDIEEDYDFLVIRDGNNIESHVLGEYTGSSVPTPVEVDTGVAYIYFTSDDIINSTGFVLEWETLGSECGGDYSSRSGSIRHPISGSNYQNNDNCVWTITTGEPFKITFFSFDTEEDFDVLIIRDGNSIDSRLLGNYTGNSSIPTPVEVNSGAASINFESDRSVTSTGFVIEWESLETCVDISPHCAIHAFQCDTSMFVQERCQKTCNLCYGTCVDISRDCAIHAFLCDTSTLVQGRCKKTCNLC